MERGGERAQVNVLKQTVKETKVGKKKVLQKNGVAENKSIVKFGFIEHQSEIELSSSSSICPWFL